MNQKDKKLIKKSALVMADQIASSIIGLNIAWGLSKVYYIAGMELRQERALEFVEMIRDNPDIFIKDILENQNFQDGFVYFFEKYIRERNEEKRQILKSIFLEFSETKNKVTYPLERMVHVTAQLGGKDIRVLKDVDMAKGNDQNYQIYGNTDENLESIFSLINLGILLEATGSRLGPVDAPFVIVSEFGKKYIEYLRNS